MQGLAFSHVFLILFLRDALFCRAAAQYLQALRKLVCVHCVGILDFVIPENFCLSVLVSINSRSSSASWYARLGCFVGSFGVAGFASVSTHLKQGVAGLLLCLKAISSRVILRLSLSTSIHVTINLPSTSSPPLWFLRVVNLSAFTQMNGAVYNSLPIPQLKPARLKASLASPFPPPCLTEFRHPPCSPIGICLRPKC